SRRRTYRPDRRTRANERIRVRHRVLCSVAPSCRGALARTRYGGLEGDGVAPMAPERPCADRGATRFRLGTRHWLARDAQELCPSRGSERGIRSDEHACHRSLVARARLSTLCRCCSLLQRRRGASAPPPGCSLGGGSGRESPARAIAPRGVLAGFGLDWSPPT